jgi:uncharacterized membrane-anchored protein
MSYSNIGQTFSNLASGIINALGSLINAIVSFISQNADVFGVVLGVGIMISAILGLTGRIPFLNNLLGSLGFS